MGIFQCHVSFQRSILTPNWVCGVVSPTVMKRHCEGGVVAGSICLHFIQTLSTCGEQAWWQRSHSVTVQHLPTRFPMSKTNNYFKKRHKINIRWTKTTNQPNNKKSDVFSKQGVFCRFKNSRDPKNPIPFLLFSFRHFLFQKNQSKLDRFTPWCVKDVSVSDLPFGRPNDAVS